MTVIELAITPHPPWRYRWQITLTRTVPGQPGRTWEETRTARTPDELCDVILHTSFDPSIVAYNYHRYTTLPAACPSCGEPYAGSFPRQEWHACACGGHLVSACTACGDQQAYPPLDH
jgi:hypothetical protein